MASKFKAECSLNTTECILETIASILGEIQEQNNEYNWDPLTFVFTAIIGVIAIVFAALTAFQSLLAAGPGRTKSGAYAIGPWSQLNRRKFDFAEMRFRTTASTPILTIDSLDLQLLEGDASLAQDPAQLRKGEDDYFPATWLALLSHLSLDHTKLWNEVKITGADFIPSELSAVPAYGSIRFVATLAMILSEGFARLSIDRETGLPRIRDRYFNLAFRHHPLLGVIGFFEMYGKMAHGYPVWGRELYQRLLQAYGHMDTSAPRRDDEWTRTNIKMYKALTFNQIERDEFKRSFRRSLRRECPHRDQQPKPACLNLFDCLQAFYPGFFTEGPLYLLLAQFPEPYPCLFPSKRTRLCERLTTLLLQSRFWSMKSSASSDLSPSRSENEAHAGLYIAKNVTSWARLEIKPDIDKLDLSNDTYALCLEYLHKTLDQERQYDILTTHIKNLFQRDVESLDLWLKKMEPHVLCRKLTLSVVGEGIQQIIDTIQQQSNVKAKSDVSNAAVLSSLDGSMLPTLHGKLSYFLKAIDDPNTLDCLYSGAWGRTTYSEEKLDRVRHDTYEGLRKVQDLWELDDLPLNDDVGESEDMVHSDREHKTRAWRFPSVTLHPLDDVLIYRAVLITLIYCLSSDSSDLMDDAYDIIVPIM